MRILKVLHVIAVLFFAGNVFAQDAGDPNARPKKDYGKSFFAKDSIHVIKLNFIQCNYWDSLVYYRKISDSLNVSNYMQASVSVDGKRYYSCGVRFKGESSYEFYPGKKKPFRIKFNKYVKG